MLKWLVAGKYFYVRFMLNGWSWFLVVDFSLGLGWLGCWRVVVGIRVGANAMFLAWDGKGGLRNSGFGVC